MNGKAIILVVDDQPTNVFVLSEALQNEYDMRVADNGERALQLLAKPPRPDLILLDVMMPGMDGFEVCRRLKNDSCMRHIPVIFITACDNPAQEELGLQLGAIDYIRKPFSIPVVRARVNNHILLKQRAELLEELASIDPLTQLANRRCFDSRFSEEWKRAQRDGSLLSLLMIDVDHFKNYNDHYGHGAGDLCLQQVAAALRGPDCRPSDLVARFGGEEFVVILPNTGAEGAQSIAERLRQRVQALQIPHAYSAAAEVVSISIGCATMQPAKNGADAEQLLQAADHRLYVAKEGGRNRVT